MLNDTAPLSYFKDNTNKYYRVIGVRAKLGNMSATQDVNTAALQVAVTCGRQKTILLSEQKSKVQSGRVFTMHVYSVTKNRVQMGGKKTVATVNCCKSEVAQLYQLCQLYQEDKSDLPTGPFPLLGALGNTRYLLLFVANKLNTAE